MSYPKDDRGKGAKLEQQCADANAELQRAVDLSAFVISQETEKIIRNFLNRKIHNLKSVSPFEIMETGLEHVKKCLSEVKEAAKKDLSL